MNKLKRGDQAPSFALLDQAGNTVKLSDYRGQKVLVYFYPKADTPGCVRQACAVRDAHGQLIAQGISSVGISPDLPEEQKRFDQKYSLGFALLSDPDHEVANAYGVWTGEDFVRSSFLVDEKGKILEAWYRVRPEDTVPNVWKSAA